MSDLGNQGLSSPSGDNPASASIPPFYSGHILADPLIPPPLPLIGDVDHDEHEIFVHELSSIPEIDFSELVHQNEELTFRERNELYRNIIEGGVVESLLSDLTRLEESLKGDSAHSDSFEDGLKSVDSETKDNSESSKDKEATVALKSSKLATSKFDPALKEKELISPLNRSYESQDGTDGNASVISGTANSSLGEEDLQKSSTRWSMSVGSPSEERGSLTDFDDDIESVSHRSEASKENELEEPVTRRVQTQFLTNIDTPLPTDEVRDSLQKRIEAWKIKDRTNAKDT